MLATVEKELAGEPFVVIGVHSPKFPNETDEGNVRDAVRRYAVTHPVVVDSGHQIWSQYGVRAWPTLVLVDPRGYVVGAGSGEPDAATLSAAVRRVLEENRPHLDPAPLPLRPEPSPPGTLAYPGKVIVSGDRVFVADTGHHQVVVCDAGGVEIARIGSGRPGHTDGSFAGAMLHHPNGLAVDDTRSILWIADTGTHTIRRADLDAGTVATIAGTGEMGRGFTAGGPGPRVALRSPWDLAWDGRRLYVAMAGSHQIWTCDPDGERAGPFAGAGPEMRRDGPARLACFAQPSGIAHANGSLYVADSEVSSVRAIDGLDDDPVVRTVCGSGDLFGFGDRDGAGEDVLLQHPIGVAAGDDGVLFVADTFNHRIKAVDPRTGECRTLFGSGIPERLPELVPGYALARADAVTSSFYEPEGVAVRGRELLVADTNNHRVVVVSLDDGARRVLLGSGRDD